MFFISIIKIIILFLLTFYGLAWAETPFTCPSIESVHQLRNIWPHGAWLPLYEENSELASEKDIANFSKVATGFRGAEWSGDFLEMAHCHYTGENRIVLARDMLKPNTEQYPKWQFISPALARCLSCKEDDCSYSDIG